MKTYLIFGNSYNYIIDFAKLHKNDIIAVVAENNIDKYIECEDIDYIYNGNFSDDSFMFINLDIMIKDNLKGKVDEVYSFVCCESQDDYYISLISMNNIINIAKEYNAKFTNIYRELKENIYYKAFVDMTKYIANKYFKKSCNILLKN